MKGKVDSSKHKFEKFQEILVLRIHMKKTNLVIIFFPFAFKIGQWKEKKKKKKKMRCY